MLALEIVGCSEGLVLDMAHKYSSSYNGVVKRRGSSIGRLNIGNSWSLKCLEEQVEYKSREQPEVEEHFEDL